MIKLTIYITFFISLFSCSMFKKGDSSKVAKEEVAILTLEKEPCRGTCESYRMEVYSDYAIYEGLRYAEKEGVHRVSIDKKQLAMIKDQASKANFSALNESYVNEGIADVPRKFITYNGKKITFHEHESPEELKQLYTDLETYLKSLDWKKEE